MIYNEPLGNYTLTEMWIFGNNPPNWAIIATSENPDDPLFIIDSGVRMRKDILPEYIWRRN